MIGACAHCRAAANYLVHGFDRAMCLVCGGHTLYDGRPTVPTSALSPGATYDGPGKDLIPDPNRPDVTQGIDPTPQLAQPVAPPPPVDGTQPADQDVLPTPPTVAPEETPRADTVPTGVPPAPEVSA